jgi:DNA (cytosine-5)-methyltransferase 3A
MRVVSLFDGVSCARVALGRAGHPVEDYFASEVDKHAIAVAQKNFPDTIQCGDVKEICGNCFGKVDLLIGGSPCQDLSIAKKDRKGLDGERSGLFWEYVRVWKKVNPTWFVLENVASMSKADREVITKEMGVEPVMFDASLVSAQSRRRLFWTNIPFVLPADKHILLKDILQLDGEVDERMVCRGKAFCLDANYHKVSANERQQSKTIQRRERTLVKVGHLGGSDAQANRIYSVEGKSATLSAHGGGLGAKTGLYSVPADATGGGVRVGHEVVRRLDDRGIRKDEDTSLPYTRILEVRDDEKCGTLTSVQKDNYVVEPHRIRKLTPIECERLHGLPDDYTAGIAMTNRYRCLGNAFNVDVVAHILASIPKDV